MVARVVAGMRRCAKPPCTAVIGVGDCMPFKDLEEYLTFRIEKSGYAKKHPGHDGPPLKVGPARMLPGRGRSSSLAGHVGQGKAQVNLADRHG